MMKNQVLVLCHFLVAMCTCIPQKKNYLQSTLHLGDNGQLMTLLLIISCCGRGFMVTQIGEWLPWLTILRGVFQLATQSFE